MRETVSVALPGREYDVIIGPGLLADAGALIAPLLRRKRVAVITESRVAALHLQTLRDGLAAEGIAMSATALATLMLGVDVGILVGVAMSLALHLYGTSRPHSAEVGRIPGTEHFRNVRRHAVETDAGVAIDHGAGEGC